MTQLFMGTSQPTTNESTAQTLASSISPPTGWEIYMAQYESVSPGTAGAGRLVVIYRAFPADETEAATLNATLSAALLSGEIILSNNYVVGKH